MRGAHRCRRTAMPGAAAHGRPHHRVASPSPAATWLLVRFRFRSPSSRFARHGPRYTDKTELGGSRGRLKETRIGPIGALTAATQRTSRFVIRIKRTTLSRAGATRQCAQTDDRGTSYGMSPAKAKSLLWGGGVHCGWRPWCVTCDTVQYADGGAGTQPRCAAPERGAREAWAFPHSMDGSPRRHLMEWCGCSILVISFAPIFRQQPLLRMHRLVCG